MPALAAAQAAPSPSRVTPESLAPLRAAPDGTVDLPENAAAQAPAGAEALQLRVGGVMFEGVPADSPAAATDAIAAARIALAGQTVTVADLYAAAGRIEAAYAAAGFVLTRVTLPPQHLADGGAVHFLVVDGFIESVDVSALPAPVRGVVARRLAPLANAHGLTLAQIERRVLLAGDVPGVHLRSTLVRGAAVGATRLVVGGDWRPVSGSLGFENDLGRDYQYEAFTVQVALNSVLGFGEQIYGTVTTGPDMGHLFDGDSHRRIVGVGAVVPLGNDGLTLNPEYTRVDTNPRAATGTAPLNGFFERVAVRAAWPAIRGRRENLNLTGGIELSSEIETAKGLGPINHDRLRVLVFGADYARSLGHAAVIDAQGQVSVGLAGLGARTRADATASGVPLSREGSSPDFSKADVTLRLSDGLGEGFDLTAIVRAQASFSGALPAAAEFSVDGGDALSAFPLGAINADSGVTARAEIGRPITLAVAGGARLTPYGFVAIGYGHVADPTAVEIANLHSWSAGGGVRLLISPGWHGVSTYGQLEVSHGHVTAAGNLVAGHPDNDPTRVNASLSFRF